MLSQGPGAGRSKMNCKTHILTLGLIAGCLTLAGCGDRIDQRLVGKWQITKPDSINRKVSGEQETQQPEQPNMTIEFSSSGKLVTTTQMGKIDSVKTGSWKVLESAKDSNRIKIQCQLGMQTTEHEVEIEGDAIRWIPPNLAGTKQKILFDRANK